MQPEFPAEGTVKNTIEGTVLFDGLAYGHFGHALCESTARLWALDLVDDRVDNILFLPKKKLTWPDRSLKLVRLLLKNLGDLPPCMAINEPTRFERLNHCSAGFWR